MSFLLISFMFCQSSFAAVEPKIEKILDLLHSDQMVMGNSMQSQYTQMEMLMKRLPGGSTDARRNEFRAEFEKTIKAFYKTSYEKMKPSLVKAYRDTYTESELDELLRFYQSPVGKKSVDIAPEAIRKNLTAAQEKIMPAQKELSVTINTMIRKYFPEMFMPKTKY